MIINSPYAQEIVLVTNYAQDPGMIYYYPRNIKQQESPQQAPSLSENASNVTQSAAALGGSGLLLKALSEGVQRGVTGAPSPAGVPFFIITEEFLQMFNPGSRA